MKYCLFKIIAITTLVLISSFRVHAAMDITPQRDIPTPLYGVTIDDTSRLHAIVDSLKSLSQKPTTRIVFDEWVAARDYVESVNEIHDVSYVMGEVLDSYYVKDYSVKQYLKRTEEYMDTLGSKVDIWEIGNEINGNWLGKTSDVVAKMTGSYDLVEARGGKTALTFFHYLSTKKMLNWAEKNVPKRMKQGVDYVFVSYYDYRKDKLNWNKIFKRFGVMFPNAKLGFGEVGTEKHALKKSRLKHYYTMKIDHPNYVGGYFWWYGKQDMVPKYKPLWKTLNNVIANKVASRN